MFEISEFVPSLTKEERKEKIIQHIFFRCRCCNKEDGSLYMVSNDLWLIANLDLRCGFVCIQCLNNRLIHYRNKALTLKDLSLHQVNDPILFAITLEKE